MDKHYIRMTGDSNNALRQFRAANGLSQEALAIKLGCKRQYVARIECGESDGKKSFWLDIQRIFNVPDDQMWKLYRGEALY